MRYKYPVGPVMTEDERCAVVASCRYVDEVIKMDVYKPSVEFIDAMQVGFMNWAPSPAVTEQLQYIFQVDLVAYNSSVSGSFGEFVDRDRFLPTERTTTVSTTQILKRVLNNVPGIYHRVGINGGNEEEVF
jgi:glycerol-3-phosphate cytidylyltransferase-like family protein